MQNQMMPMNSLMMNEIDQKEVDSLVSKGYTVEQALAVIRRQQQQPYLKSTSRDDNVVRD
jgi:type II secretory pathway component PulF